MKIKEVIVYTNPFCLPCTWIKNWYSSNDIKFIEKQLTTEENYNEFKSVKSEGTPTTRIIYENGEESIIVGYQIKELETKLGM